MEEGLQEAYAWLYRRLNRQAARFLQPFLELHVGRTLVHALRLQRAEKPEALRHLLGRSLLPEDFRRDLLAAADAERFVAVLERRLGSRSQAFHGLGEVYAEQGPGGVEEQLTSSLWQRAVRLAREGTVKELVQSLIDLRNLVAIAKHWRWQVTRPPQLVSGGGIDPCRLRRVWRARDEAGLEQLAGRLAGTPGRSLLEPREIETAVLRRQTLLLQRRGRDPVEGGVLLDYLWRCRMAARNRSLFIRLEEDNDELLDDVLVMP